MRTSAILILVITVILAPIAIWEFESQPLIDYTLESNSTLDLHFNSSISVNLMVRNRGGLDATVWLSLTVENATIQEIHGSNIIYNSTKTQASVFLPKNTENWGIGLTLNVVPTNGTQTFSVLYGLTKVFGLTSIFYTINPILPTTLTFNQTQPEIYTEVP
jgi:hypothetical protein